VFKNTFRSDFHIVDDTMLIPGYPILIGQDFGRNPWSLICQMDHMGRLLVHQEVPGTNVGLEKHVEQNLRPVMFSNKYLGFRVCCVGDPSGIAKGSIGEESCFDALSRMGFPCFPAPTNDIEPRLRAVEALLGQQVNGGPKLMISRAGAPFLCRAMSGGYRFTKWKTGALKTVPEKQDKEGFSHVADDLQYVSLVVHGGIVPEITRRLRPRTKKRGAVSAQAGPNRSPAVGPADRRRYSEEEERRGRELPSLKLVPSIERSSGPVDLPANVVRLRSRKSE